MYVDTHCHLDHHASMAVAEQVQRATAADVGLLVTVGTDVESSTRAVDTARRHDGVWAAVGIHPNDADTATPDALDAIDRLADDEVVVALGETGMDFHWDATTPARQEAALRAHVDLARSHDKALVVHCRDAWAETLAILDDHGAPERVVMHCFSGDRDVVDHCAARDWFMSFAGNVTFHNAEPLRHAAAAVPDHLLLTETDSPFLTPHPHRGTANDPSMVPLVAAQLAQLHGVEVPELVATVAANAHRAFATATTAMPAKAR